MTGKLVSIMKNWVSVGILAATAMLLPSEGQAQEAGRSLPYASVENQGIGQTALVLGSGKSLTDARKTFETEARQGYAPAQVNLAVLYLNGWGTEKNYGAALYWLKEAAKQGQPRAYTNLGVLYLKGWGVAQDVQEALKDFRFAAEHNETGAMVNVGYMMENGMGTAKDQSEAAEWYRRAADRGDALGQNNLADLYLRGLGVPQSDALAAEWFQKAADHGQSAARIKLGFLHMTGRGVTKDLAAAYELILAASLAGDHRGDEYLEDLGAQMDAEELEAATRRARELQAAQPTNAAETAMVR